MPYLNFNLYNKFCTIVNDFINFLGYDLLFNCCIIVLQSPYIIKFFIFFTFTCLLVLEEESNKDNNLRNPNINPSYSACAEVIVLLLLILETLLSFKYNISS